MPLEEEQQTHRTRAEGFIELGMYLEADTALDDIDPYARHLPEVLAIRLRIYRAMEKWELMQAVAKRLVSTESENPQLWMSWAEATRGAESVEAGRLILVNAIKEGTSSAALFYALAEYECVLGNVEGAKRALHECFRLDPGMRVKALDNEALEPLWASL